MYVNKKQKLEVVVLSYKIMPTKCNEEYTSLESYYLELSRLNKKQFEMYM